MRKCHFCHGDVGDAAILCPHCRKNAIAGRASTPLPMDAPAAVAVASTTKACPFCAAEIRDGAIVCIHCRQRLPRPSVAPWRVALQCGLGFAALVIVAKLYSASFPAPVIPAPASVNAAAPAIVKPTRPVMPVPVSRKLQLLVSGGDPILLIRNASTEHYHDLAVSIVVGGHAFGQYVSRLRTPDFAPRQEFHFDMRDAATIEGVRFDPSQYRPSQVIVTGHHEDGTEGAWSGSQ
jgi:hypothetical protein